MKLKTHRHYRCPNCGSKGGRLAVWDMPSPELATEDVFIGGCCPELDPSTGLCFDRGCLDCHHLWLSGWSKKPTPFSG